MVLVRDNAHPRELTLAGMVFQKYRAALVERLEKLHSIGRDNRP